MPLERPHAHVMGVGGFKAEGRPPAPLTTEGDSLPSQGEGRGGVGGGRYLPPLGASICLLAVQRSGGRVATIWGMPGGSAKRGRRAEGPEEPAGGLPPKRRRGLCRFASAWSHQQAEAAAKS